MKALPPDGYAKWIADAKASGADMDRNRYADLVKPSMALVSPSAYRSVEPALFQFIVNGSAPPQPDRLDPDPRLRPQASSPAVCGGT